MNRRILLHEGVASDLFEAFSYFEAEAPEQVDRLCDTSLTTIQKRIPLFPNAFAPLFGQFRHIYLRPFKYYIAYRVTDETIDILAVRHGTEHPSKAEGEISKRRFE